MPDLLTILSNVGQVGPLIIEVMQGMMLTAGLILTGMALLEFYCISNDGATRFLPSASRYTALSATTQLIIGACLLSLGTLELVGVLTRTVTGTTVTSRLMMYQVGGGSMQAEAQVATQGLLSLLQVVGFAAMARSLFILNARAHGKDSSSAMAAWCFAIGGLIAWNFQLFAQFLDSWLGINILGVFASSMSGSG